MSLRLLVVSVAAINEPHRRAYHAMAEQLGWEVHIAAPKSIRFVAGKPPSVLAPAPAAARYELHPLEHRFYTQPRLHWFVGLELLVARLRPHVVFCEYDPGSLPILQAKAAPCGQRVIAFTVENIARDRWHDLAENVRARSLRGALRDGLVASLSTLGGAATDGLACISEQGTRIFRAQGWSKPIGVVPLGTDMRAFAPGNEQALRAQLGLAGKFVVSYFGRLVREKGVHVLLEAFAKTSGDAVLLLDMYTNFAPGSYADELMKLADRLGIRERIRTIDVPHAEVPRYMRCADVLVLPSLTTERWKEQFGRVLPEAMACGIPVIGSRSGNIPDMIGDAGLLVPEGDSDALARAIDELSADVDQRRALAVRGRSRVAQHFSLEAQARALARLVDELGVTEAAASAAAAGGY